MSQLNAEQLAQRIFDCGLMGAKELDAALQLAGGRGQASFDNLVTTLVEQELLTNWQIARVVEGHRTGYFYGNWAVLYMIGHGTFARVYRSVHRKTGDIKAVKVLRQRYSADLESREQFMREARMVMKLRHPNIVPIHEVEQDKARIYMVMDFVEGQNLREYASAHGRLPVITALKIIRDVAAGLEHAAKFNITHRDMKLSNVLLSAKGLAKLVDFGLATVSGDKDDEKGGPRSIDYAGLERCTGVRRDDPRSDIYFLGCMLYQLVSGAAPLLETRERIKRLSAGRYQDVRPVTSHAPDLPHRVAILVGRMMDLDASKRIQDPTQAMQETDSVLRAIEAGDNKEFDSELTEKQTLEHAAKISEREEGGNRTILIIESNTKLQDSLRERLKNLGYKVLITADPVRGLARFEDLEETDEILPADCVIFGCVGLGKAAISAFVNFAQGRHTSRIPAIIVVPENLQTLINPKWLGDLRMSFTMPLKMKKLRKGLKRLLKLENPKSGSLKKVESTVPTQVVPARTDTDTDVD